MGVITRPYTFVSGNTILAAENNSNETTIYNEFNGNIENANIKSTAAIAESKLSLVRTFTSKTAAYTLTSTDDGLTCDASGGAFTVTLPTASGIVGKEYIVYKNDSSANAVTVDGNGSETINGSSTYALTTQYGYVIVKSDGTNWGIVSSSTSGTSKWTVLVATTDFSTTAASTSTITMATDQTANILVGYEIRFTLSSVVYYGQVTALTSTLMTIRGAPLTTGAGDLTALSYSTLPSQVDVLDLSVDGYYEDATNSTLILSDLRKRLVWEESKAYVVGWDMSQRTVDTGTEANVTVMVNAAAVGTANTNQGPTMSGTADTVVSTVVDINTSNYDINRGELLDVQVTKAGNGDAVDMTLLVTVVYP